MAVCNLCGLDMVESDSCGVKTVEIEGSHHDRIPYAKKEGFQMPDRCHDCNVVVGGIHHWHCDMEECPVCGGQFISCGHCGD